MRIQPLPKSLVIDDVVFIVKWRSSQAIVLECMANQQSDYRIYALDRSAHTEALGALVASYSFLPDAIERATLLTPRGEITMRSESRLKQKGMNHE